ncbi:MAG: DNA polymerase III subunit delta [Alphaproteobacteria bacterium]|nr:DNA polymerase III subunit delta [Alphaproteobacteria bacterium]MCL2504887.1 DNA polymerase III subunit delta [Alphaproteobacteria bacterium]
MKIPPARIDAFVKAPDKSLRVFLVYGADLGLVHERAVAISKYLISDVNDPFSSVTLDADKIAKEPFLLIDEMCSISFFGSSKLVKIRNPASDIANAVSALLSHTSINNTLIIEDGELSAKSKLRKICEDHALAAAIPCYVEDNASKSRFIRDFLSQNSISADSSVINAVAEVMPPNRLAMRSELDKFVTYIGNSKTASMEDVEACFQSAAGSSVDDLILAAASGNTSAAMQMLDFLFAEKTPPIMILRSAQRHFMKLHFIKLQNASGISISEAVSNLKPPVFWKHKDIIAGQAAKLSVRRIEAALLRLYNSERLIKSGTVPIETLCSQTILGLSL